MTPFFVLLMITFYIITLPFTYSRQFKMGRKYCSNPLALHRRQITKNIRLVTAAAVNTGFVKEGDLVCSNCQKGLLEKQKPENPLVAEETVENPSNSVSVNVLPSNGETPTSESEEDSTAEESTAEDSIYEQSMDESDVGDIAQSVLLAVGQSPIKRKGLTPEQKNSKMKRKLQSVKENLKIAYGVNIQDESDDDEPMAKRYLQKKMLNRRGRKIGRTGEKLYGIE